MSTTSEQNQKPSRSKLRSFLLIGVPIALILGGGAFYLSGGRYAETDNAYVQSSVVLISPEVSGKVAEVTVMENQLVDAGAVLFRIDDTSFVVAKTRAEARLDQARIDFDGLKASYREKQGEIAAAQIKYDFAQKTLQRQSSLAAKNVLPEANLEDAQQASTLAQQQIETLQQDLKRILASVGGSIDTPFEQSPGYASAMADLNQAKLDLAHTTVTAPTRGFVSKLPANGQNVTAGTTSLALVAAANMRVDANFTETELTYVKPGQPVTVTVDTYPDLTWKGSVDSISPATGAAYSVIPAQNATGNWVKIAQRIPVRIKLDANSAWPQLRVGMSAHVSIDTDHKRSLLGLSF